MDIHRFRYPGLDLSPAGNGRLTGSEHPQAQLFASFLVDNQAYRAGVHHSIDRELPDLILGHITPPRVVLIPAVYQGYFRSYFSHVMLLTSSIL
jgi:hypothetical protein